MVGLVPSYILPFLHESQLVEEVHVAQFAGHAVHLPPVSKKYPAKHLPETHLEASVVSHPSDAQPVTLQSFVHFLLEPVPIG